MLTFDRLIVIRNPVSTHQERAERRIAELRILAPQAELIVVETVPGGRTANRRLLERYVDKLGPGTLLCIAAGDGTINLMVETLLTAPKLSAAARQTPILPLWCGNGNDLACMLNGAPRTSLRKVFTAGKPVAIRPLRIALTTPGKEPDIRLSACYVSFGASAYAAQALAERIRTRRRIDMVPGARFVRELAAVASVLMQAPVFQVAQAGDRQPIFESIFLKGPRFAKVRAVPLKITDDAFHHATVEHKRVADLLQQLALLTRRKHVAAVRRTHTTFTVYDAAWAQFDGETVQLPSGTRVEITLAPRPFYAIASSAEL